MGFGTQSYGPFDVSGAIIWYDTYFGCSTACPSTTSESDVGQIWTANLTYPLGTNTIVYKCTSITIDGN